MEIPKFPANKLLKKLQQFKAHGVPLHLLDPAAQAQAVQSLPAALNQAGAGATSMNDANDAMGVLGMVSAHYSQSPGNCLLSHCMLSLSHCIFSFTRKRCAPLQKLIVFFHCPVVLLAFLF